MPTNHNSKPFFNISTFLICILLICSVKVAIAEDYEYVKNNSGQKICLIYEKNGEQKHGELAIHSTNRNLLFISCDKKEIYADEKYFRRYSRNCNNVFSEWPENLVEHITLALGEPIVLTGPPSSCGACMPVPYQDFTLPQQVTIEPEILEMYDGAIFKEGDSIDNDKLIEAPRNIPYTSQPLINLGIDGFRTGGHSPSGGFPSGGGGGMGSF